MMLLNGWAENKHDHETTTTTYSKTLKNRQKTVELHAQARRRSTPQILRQT